MEHLKQFALARGVKGMKIKDIEEKGRSPFLIVDVEASAGAKGQAPDQ
jgi:hypothetical protein